MNLNVELKGITGPNGLALSKSMVKQVEEQLTNLNQNQEVLISSFNVVLVKLAEEIMPQYNRAVIFHTTSFREDWRTLLDYCNAKIVNTEDAKLTKAKVKMVKEAGYELNVWTVNKPKTCKTNLLIGELMVSLQTMQIKWCICLNRKLEVSLTFQ